MVSKGDVAEAAVALHLLRLGVTVLRPVAEGLPFDLVVLAPDGRAARIQVKNGRVRGGCVLCNAASTDHGNGRRHYRGRADAIAAYVPERDEVYVVDVAALPDFELRLRLEPARNAQRAGVRRAADHTLEAWVMGFVGEPAATGRPHPPAR